MNVETEEPVWKRFDEQGRPIIRHLRKRIGDLRYRLGHLEEVYDPRREGVGAARMKGEMVSLRAAIAVMEYHRLDVEGENSPILVLQEILDALDADDTERLDQAVERGRLALEEMGS